MEWVCNEVALNLEKPLPSSQDSQNFWREPLTPGAHDSRGTRQYVSECVVGAVAEDCAEHWPHPNIVVANREAAKRRENQGRERKSGGGVDVFSIPKVSSKLSVVHDDDL